MESINADLDYTNILLQIKSLKSNVHRLHRQGAYTYQNDFLNMFASQPDSKKANQRVAKSNIDNEESKF